MLGYPFSQRVPNVFGVIQTRIRRQRSDMSAVPGSIDTEYQPPLAVPLWHFLVALGFLLAGGALGLVARGGLASLAHVHATVLGWVCLTIMGAMTQFVPVWSGTRLHSRRLARLQLLLVAGGLVGFLTALLTGRLALLPIPALILLAGFWTFVYNVGRSLWSVRPLDTTERHFAFALGCLLVVTAAGVLLAADYTHRLVPVALRSNLVAAHATLAVFGVVLATIAGASYQLAAMFTQTEIAGLDARLQRVETIAYPVGVGLLAVGRLLGVAALARAGGLLTLLGATCLAVVIARRLFVSRVEWTPMLRRYAAFAGCLLAWVVVTLPAWLGRPLSSAHRFGATGANHLLLLGAIGSLVAGTLYHVVPFIVWVDRYSDDLGREPVPMIDDLYDDRLATGDLLAVGVGTTLLVGSDLLASSSRIAAVGGTLALVGFALFALNLGLVVYRHAPGAVRGPV
jgi:hypothetical protein